MKTRLHAVRYTGWPSWRAICLELWTAQGSGNGRGQPEARAVAADAKWEPQIELLQSLLYMCKYHFTRSVLKFSLEKNCWCAARPRHSHHSMLPHRFQFMDVIRRAWGPVTNQHHHGGRQPPAVLLDPWSQERWSVTAMVLIVVASRFGPPVPRFPHPPLPLCDLQVLASASFPRCPVPHVPLPPPRVPPGLI